MPAWIAVITDKDEELARFPVEAKEGWGEDLQRQLRGIMAALQDALDREVGRQQVLDQGWWP